MLGKTFMKDRRCNLFQLQNFGVKLQREFFTVCTPLPELGKPDKGFNAPFAQEIDQVGDEGHVLPITDLLALAIRGAVARLNSSRPFERSVKTAAMEIPR